MAKDKSTDANELDSLLSSVRKEFGDGAVMVGNNGPIVKVDAIPTGVASIDLALGCGGLPRGRIMEIYGSESSGKTTTCLHFIAACQKHYFEDKQRYGRAAFIDAEHALDMIWAARLGVDVDNLLLSQPDYGEEAFKIVDRMVKSGLVDLVVVDSVAALIPKAEFDGEVGDVHVGGQARMLSQAMRKLKSSISSSKTTVVFINQIREKVGITFGNPEVTPGGRALKFYSTIRANISKGTSLKSKDEFVGFRPKMKIVKNKVAAPFKIAYYDICVGNTARPIYGIDTMASLLEVASDKDIKIVNKSGNFYKYGDVSLGNGMGNAAQFLYDNQEIAKEIRQKTYDSALPTVKDGAMDEPIDDEIIDDD